MKTYKTQKEVEKDIKDGVLKVDGDVEFLCDIAIPAKIIAWDINAGNINAWNINAGTINAGDIEAWDIEARNIEAWNIEAWDISYYAFLVCYGSLTCKSYEAHRENHADPICLDGKLTVTGEEEDIITLNGEKYKKI